MKRKKITREFREKVVKEYMESGESAKTIARKYGISDMSVLNWMKKYRKQPIERDLQKKKRKKLSYIVCRETHCKKRQINTM